MISAIAARKATLAPSTQTGRITKRRASQTAKKSKNARKSKPFESSNGWNGIVAQSAMPTGHDLLNEQQDVLIMDSGREIEMSELADGNDAVWSGHDRPPSAEPPTSLPDDSSEDDDHDTHGEGIQLETLLPQISVRLNDRVAVLSNFEPAAGQNIFIISGEECSSLGVTGPGTLVCLTADDTLCLLGNFRLTVLWGLLDLFGNVLTASKTAHRVYAPRCSPLPIIKSGQGQNPAFIPDDQTIPSRLRGIFGFNTVVMFQPLETGVEGLGRICHPFDGIFEPSRSQRVSTSSAMEVSGLHMVCYAASLVLFS
jgi:polynucleotide 5'-hydroxyl-kinase GRC3/NOL9